MAIRALFVVKLTKFHFPFASISQSLHSKEFSSTARFKNSLEFLQDSKRRKLVSLSNLFLRYGFPSSGLHDFLTKNRFLLGFDPPEIEKSIRILLSLKPSQDFVVSVITGCPGVLEYEFMKQWTVDTSRNGFSWLSSLALQNVLQVCKRCELGRDIFLRYVRCLKGSGFSQSTMSRIFEACPMVITLDLDVIQNNIEFLTSKVGIARNEVDGIFNIFPELMLFEVQKKLKPLLDEFRDLGFNSEVIRKEVLKHPRVLGSEVGEFSHCLRMLRSLKCREAIKKNIFSEGAFRACYGVKMRIDCLHKHGLTYRDAFSILWKEPRAIIYDIKDIEKKIEFLVYEKKLDIHCLLDVPKYLGINFEKQILPRFNVIDHLRSIGGLGDEVGLRELIKPSRLKFYNQYVKPYPECEVMYGKVSRENEVRNRHPIGMWKLLKPNWYPETEQDAKNIKSFMENVV